MLLAMLPCSVYDVHVASHLSHRRRSQTDTLPVEFQVVCMCWGTSILSNHLDHACCKACCHLGQTAILRHAGTCMSPFHPVRASSMLHAVA
jgi:hypothetical protein